MSDILPPLSTSAHGTKTTEVEICQLEYVQFKGMGWRQCWINSPFSIGIQYMPGSRYKRTILSATLHLPKVGCPTHNRLDRNRNLNRATSIRFTQSHRAYLEIHTSLPSTPRSLNIQFSSNSIQTFPDLRNSYVPKRMTQLEFCANRNSVYTRLTVCIYTTAELK